MRGEDRVEHIIRVDDLSDLQDLDFVCLQNEDGKNRYGFVSVREKNSLVSGSYQSYNICFLSTNKQGVVWKASVMKPRKQDVEAGRIHKILIDLDSMIDAYSSRKSSPHYEKLKEKIDSGEIDREELKNHIRAVLREKIGLITANTSNVSRHLNILYLDSEISNIYLKVAALSDVENSNEQYKESVKNDIAIALFETISDRRTVRSQREELDEIYKSTEFRPTEIRSRRSLQEEANRDYEITNRFLEKKISELQRENSSLSMNVPIGENIAIEPDDYVVQEAEAHIINVPAAQSLEYENEGNRENSLSCTHHVSVIVGLGASAYFACDAFVNGPNAGNIIACFAIISAVSLAYEYGKQSQLSAREINNFSSLGQSPER